MTIGSYKSVPGIAFTSTDGGISWTTDALPTNVVDLGGVSCVSGNFCVVTEESYNSSLNRFSPVILTSSHADPLGRKMP
jgi:hypothetical protein